MSEPRTRDPRPYIYAAFCGALAVLYFALFRRLVPSQHASTQSIAYSMMVVMLLVATALPFRKPWSWWVGVVGSGYMLVIAVVLFALIIYSAAFLSGVYGAFGRGAASMALLAAALIIEAVALIPALLMKYLMTRAGRRAYALPPLQRASEADAEA